MTTVNIHEAKTHRLIEGIQCGEVMPERLHAALHDRIGQASGGVYVSRASL